jgi:hypothetical protein
VGLGSARKERNKADLACLFQKTQSPPPEKRFQKSDHFLISWFDSPDPDSAVAGRSARMSSSFFFFLVAPL